MNNLIIHINNIYSFNPKVRILNKVEKGYLSENHILGNQKEKYFLKKYRFDNPETVNIIHQVKFYFASSGVPVILPLLNKKGESYFIYKDNIFALFPFINGTHLDKKVPDKTIKSLAEHLAKIHIAGKNATISAPLAYKQKNSEETLNKMEKINQIISDKKAKDNFDLLALTTLKLKKNFVLKTKITSKPKLSYDHLIHGDYQDQNIFIKDNKVSHIFDWEKASISARILEVLRAMEYIFINDSFTKTNINNALTFLKYYHLYYPLTKDEIINGIEEYIQGKFFSLWVETEHYLNNNMRVDIFLSSQYASLKYFLKNKDIFTKMLLSQLKLK